MNEILNLTFASSLTDLCEKNSSFDSGVLRIAYPGLNRNGSSISREVFEKCLPSIYNCPIVCNYDRETDSLGGHDIAVVRDQEGALKLINLTVPVGCVPESGNVFWQNVTEDDGTSHEYLCAEVLLWKRQEAYQKIKRDGVTQQSMEITVKDSETKDGVYIINDFEFTAFALIGEAPCFESAALAFSKQGFKQQFNEMMRELKESFTKVDSSNEDEDKYLVEGGEKVLNEKTVLLNKYGVKETDLDFSLDDVTVEELDAKLKEFTAKEQTAPEKVIEEYVEPSKDGEQFELASNINEELGRAVVAIETITKEWGSYARYSFMDYDAEKSEVYCWDCVDWLLYGFNYSISGDAVVINLETKKRKKFAIVDFDGGEQSAPFGEVFSLMEKKIQDSTEWEAKYRAASDTMSSMSDEITELRQFRANTEATAAKAERESVLAQFSDLRGIDEFDKLCEDNVGLSADALEEKCFALRGRHQTLNFSGAQKFSKIKLEQPAQDAKEPYGGIVARCGAADN